MLRHPGRDQAWLADQGYRSGLDGSAILSMSLSPKGKFLKQNAIGAVQEILSDFLCIWQKIWQKTLTFLIKHIKLLQAIFQSCHFIKKNWS